MKGRFETWDMSNIPDSVIFVEEEGEERRVIICRPGSIFNGWSGEQMRVEHETEWEWFLDFAGINTCHNFYQYHIISQILKQNEVECIVELGTYRGALALYLGVCGALKGIPVYTFDRDASFSAEAKPGLDKLGVGFFELDYMTPHGIEVVMSCIAGRKVYLICDGDNKAKADEFNIFVPSLASGSVVSVHDWWAEMTPNDIGETVEKYKLRPFGVRDWFRHQVRFATFVKE